MVSMASNLVVRIGIESGYCFQIKNEMVLTPRLKEKIKVQKVSLSALPVHWPGVL